MALEHVTKRGKRAKARREELGMTQEDVAERIQQLHAERNPGSERDKTRGQMISDYERGINDPRGARLELWAAALDWAVGDLEADKPKTGSADLSDIFAKAEPGSSTVEQMLREILDQQAQLLADVSVVRSEQERLSQQLEHRERGREETGS